MVCMERGLRSKRRGQLEHGNYMDEETVAMLAESSTVWVPTLVTVRNLLGCGRYDDEVPNPYYRWCLSGERGMYHALHRNTRLVFAFGNMTVAVSYLHAFPFEKLISLIKPSIHPLQDDGCR